MTHAERMARFARADLYVVITESCCAGRSSLEVLDQVLAAGVTLVQFREKDWSTAEMHARAAAFRDRTHAAGALLIIDDRVDIALAVCADGVHLGEHDLPVAAARAVAPDLVVGASAHNLDEALHAQRDGASYVNIGPIFPTQTKSLPIRPLGPEALDEVAPHLTIPWTTMGGIKLDNIGEVTRRGAKHVAVVTAVTAADDVESAARALRQAILREAAQLPNS
jgi:thiamine-phosphate pyrophosphorylase